MVNTIVASGINMSSSAAFVNIIEELKMANKIAKGSVDRKEYDKFCNEYIFDVLDHNEPFGVAFCRKFELGDYMLTRVYKNDIIKCKQLIEESGYLNDTRCN